MEDITGETQLPGSFLTPQAVPAVPAVLQPSQQMDDTASTSKSMEGGLRISIKYMFHL